MFTRKSKKDDEPPLQLKTAQRLVIAEEEVEQLPEVSAREYLALWWNSRVTHRITFALQSIGVVALTFIGSGLILNSMFGEAYAAAGDEPTATHTPLPPFPTRTSIPTVTPSITPTPTPSPQGKGKAMADIFTSAYGGFDNRFSTKLMGSKPDYEEYLLCFDGVGVQRDGTEAVWGTDPFCMPGVFDSVSRVNNILITSDVLHSIGLSEVQWTQISVHIYEHGAPDGYAIFCPAGVIADTSKFCLGRQ